MWVLIGSFTSVADGCSVSLDADDTTKKDKEKRKRKIGGNIDTGIMIYLLYVDDVRYDVPKKARLMRR